MTAGAEQVVKREKRELDSVPRLALTPEEAAEAIGVSRAFFYDAVLPELCVTRRGRRRIISVRELERWLDESADHVLP